MVEDKQQSGKHWSKDFVEHLRTIHFALIAVCIAIIILAGIYTKSEITRAHDQIKQLKILRDTWNEQWLTDAALARAHTIVCGSCALAIKTPKKLSTIFPQFVTTFVELEQRTHPAFSE